MALRVNYKGFEAIADNEHDLEIELRVVMNIATTLPARTEPELLALKGSGPKPEQLPTAASRNGTKVPTAPKTAIGVVLSDTGKSQADFVEDAMRSIGHPSGVKEIIENVSSDFAVTGNATVEETVRQVLYNYNKRFKRVGRAMFSLPEWETNSSEQT